MSNFGRDGEDPNIAFAPLSARAVLWANELSAAIPPTRSQPPYEKQIVAILEQQLLWLGAYIGNWLLLFPNRQLSRKCSRTNSVRPRKIEHPLSDEIQDHVRTDGGGAGDEAFTHISFDVVFG